MTDLVVTAYNVEFGDAVLVSIPEASPGGTETVRHLLIDVGNVFGNHSSVFKGVVGDISARTGGTVDLYVMTHEHLDHCRGLMTAANAGVPLKADYAWLTGSAAPDYYTRHRDAEEQRKRHIAAMTSIGEQLAVDDDPELNAIFENNSAILPKDVLGLSTSDCVDHLRQIAAPDATHYVDRTTNLDGAHPFKEAQLRILAPEEDTSTYYEPIETPRQLTATNSASHETPANAESLSLVPPVGIDPGAFFDLVRSRRNSNRRSILGIDKAANNTSVVLEIEWRGWRLLFTGDAEEQSWQHMLRENLVRPVHFIKVAHHGSSNGTLETALKVAMPIPAPDKKQRQALVSTHEHDYNGVPDPHTIDRYKERATFFDTRSVAVGQSVEVRFPPPERP